MKSGLFSYTISMSALSEKSRKSVEWCYALGVLGITAASGSVVCFLMFFGTAVLGLPGTLVGAAFSLSVVWDGFSDPLAGYLSDITKSRSFGRRTGYLVFGALLTALFTLLLWQTPGGGTAFRFVWLLVLLLLFQTAVTLFGTPYAALAPEICPDPSDQVRLQSKKSLFFILGNLLPPLLLLIFQLSAGGEDLRYRPEVYRQMALIIAGLTLVSGLICALATHPVSRRFPPGPRRSFAAVFGDFVRRLGDPPFRAVLLGNCFVTVASALLSGVGMHVFTYSFTFSAPEMFWVLGEIFLFVLLSQPFWVWLSRQRGNAGALRFGLFLTELGAVLLAAGFFLQAVVPSNPLLIALMTPAIVLTGVGIGSTYPLPPAMMFEAIGPGTGETASTVGGMTFVCKLSQSAAVLLIGCMLDAVGFSAASAEGGAGLPYGVRLGLVLVLAGGILLSLCLAGICFRPGGKKKPEEGPSSPDHHAESHRMSGH